MKLYFFFFFFLSLTSCIFSTGIFDSINPYSMSMIILEKNKNMLTESNMYMLENLTVQTLMNAFENGYDCDLSMIEKLVCIPKNVDYNKREVLLLYIKKKDFKNVMIQVEQQVLNQYTVIELLRLFIELKKVDLFRVYKDKYLDKKLFTYYDLLPLVSELKKQKMKTEATEIQKKAFSTMFRELKNIDFRKASDYIYRCYRNKTTKIIPDLFTHMKKIYKKDKDPEKLIRICETLKNIGKIKAAVKLLKKINPDELKEAPRKAYYLLQCDLNFIFGTLDDLKKSFESLAKNEKNIDYTLSGYMSSTECLLSKKSDRYEKFIYLIEKYSSAKRKFMFIASAIYAFTDIEKEKTPTDILFLEKMVKYYLDNFVWKEETDSIKKNDQFFNFKIQLINFKALLKIGKVKAALDLLKLYKPVLIKQLRKRLYPREKKTFSGRMKLEKPYPRDIEDSISMLFKFGDQSLESNEEYNELINDIYTNVLADYKLSLDDAKKGFEKYLSESKQRKEQILSKICEGNCQRYGLAIAQLTLQANMKKKDSDKKGTVKVLMFKNDSLVSDYNLEKGLYSKKPLICPSSGKSNYRIYVDKIYSGMPNYVIRCPYHNKKVK